MAISLESLTSRPAAGFDEPFGMMLACHERLSRMLDLVMRLRAHVAEHGADDQARQAARDVMRYFDQAAPNHHEDEELHVFPRLLSHADASVRDLVAHLRREHAQMEADWPAARAVLQGISDGAKQKLGEGDHEALDRFTGLQSAHAQAEEAVAYPAAMPLIDAAALHAMGEEMRARRGVKSAS